MDLKIGDVLVSKNSKVAHIVTYVSEISVMLSWLVSNTKCEGSCTLSSIPTLFDKIEPNNLIWLNIYNWGVESYYTKEEADKQLNKEEYLTQQAVILNMPYDEKVINT